MTGQQNMQRSLRPVPAPRVDEAVSVAIAHRADGPVYPLPDIDGDRRFSYALLADVERVLIQHGYPALGLLDDATDLQKALYEFLYSPGFAYRPHRLGASGADTGPELQEVA